MEEQPLAQPDLTSPSRLTRKSANPVKFLEKKCFVCNTKRPCDENQYNEGGLTRVQNDDTAKKILDGKEVFLGDPSYRQHNAAKRLDIILSGFSDIFAADVYHHQSCYIKFAINKTAVDTKDQDVFDDQFIDEIKEDVMSLFDCLSTK